MIGRPFYVPQNMNKTQNFRKIRQKSCKSGEKMILCKMRKYGLTRFVRLLRMHGVHE